MQISSKKPQWGGARVNSGGARPNSGGARPGAGRKPRLVAPPVRQPVLEQDQALRWYCVRTRFAAELLADTELRLAGFTVFAPTILKPATKAKRDSRGMLRAGKPARIAPLFPRYLFVQFRRTDPWQVIRGLAGVDRLIANEPDRPNIVPDLQIAAIKALCASNGCIYPAAHRVVPLASGTKARMLEGPMADLVGICSWSDGRRVRLLLEIMGGLVALTVAQTEVLAV